MAAFFWTAVARLWPDSAIHLTELPFVGMIAAIAFLGGFIVWRSSGRWLAFWGLKYPWRYPPLWCGVVFGAAFVLCFEAVSPHIVLQAPISAQRLWLSSGGLIGASALVLFGAEAAGQWRRRTLPKESEPCTDVEEAEPRTNAEGDEPSAGNAAPALEDYKSIVKWLENDEPICDPAQDRFGSARVAKRIARRMATKAGSQLIVGDLGSGKTSLMKLTRWHLARMPEGANIRIVHVELWQYDSARAAVAGILRALTLELGKHVNIVAITGVRSQYLSAMSASGGFVAGLAKALHRDADPYETLDAIDRTAAAINIRLVVWIEDIERFIDGGLSSIRRTENTAMDSERAVEMINPIRALVHGLDRLNNVSVVTASTNLLNRFDREKLARFIEEMPTLDESQVLDIISTLRTGMCDLNKGYIRVGHAGIFDVTRESITGFRYLRRALGSYETSLLDGLLIMLSSPRKIKQILRKVNDLWYALDGEIDLDDLILMTAIKILDPDSFSLIRDRYEIWKLCDYSRRDCKVKSSDKIHIDDLVPDDKNGIIKKAIEEVFSRETISSRRQGLHVKRYWDRFLSEEPPEESDRDQVVLKAMDDEDERMLVELFVSGKGDVVEHLCLFMSSDFAFSLLSPFCLSFKSISPLTWFRANDFGGSPPGFRSLWRVWIAKINEASLDELPEIMEIVKRELSKAIRLSIENIGLLSDLEYFYLFSGTERPVILFVGDAQMGQSRAAELRKELWKALVDHYANQPARLAKAVREARPWALHGLVWGSDRAQAKVFREIPFAKWPKLAATVLDAARDDQDVLAELAVFVVREASVRVEIGGEPTFTYDPDLCRLLFENEERILGLPWGALPSDGRNAGCVRAVREAIAVRASSEQQLGAP